MKPEEDVSRRRLSTRWRARIVAAVYSLGAGIILGFSIRINATLGSFVGPLEATFIVHLVGTAFAAALLHNQLGRAFIHGLGERPLYELSGGLFGVAIVLIANLIVPVMGTALAVSLFVASDLLFSSVADHYGWLGLRRIRLSRRRLVGLFLAIVGVLLVRWG